VGTSCGNQHRELRLADRQLWPGVWFSNLPTLIYLGNNHWRCIEVGEADDGGSAARGLCPAQGHGHIPPIDDLHALGVCGGTVDAGAVNTGEPAARTNCARLKLLAATNRCWALRLCCWRQKLAHWVLHVPYARGKSQSAVSMPATPVDWSLGMGSACCRRAPPPYLMCKTPSCCMSITAWGAGPKVAEKGACVVLPCYWCSLLAGGCHSLLVTFPELLS
jgi:hypothetical protein